MWWLNCCLFAACHTKKEAKGYEKQIIKVMYNFIFLHLKITIATFIQESQTALQILNNGVSQNPHEVGIIIPNV